METILDKIIATKKKEVAVLKERIQSERKVPFQRKSFVERLADTKELAIIAEFKRASPSKGDINPHLDPGTQALTYVGAGADAVSVLTDETFFKGSMNDLERVRAAISKPILCKDFIIDTIQIDAAKKAGANVILLIAAALDDEQLHALYQYAKEQQLDVLMEIHNEKEAERVLKTDNRLIGVNNRNLKTFEVNLEMTEKLAPQIISEGRYLISESGIRTIDDVKRVIAAGAKGILVGETLMKHKNPALILKEMKLPLREGL